MIVRFFIGILGASFVPCQVWTTAFFDKNVVGSANALTAGFGNAGGGITYFLMPAIFDSLVKNQHLSAHVAWRITFIVPFVCITATAIAMIILCPDTPRGKWSNRQLDVNQSLTIHETASDITRIPGELADKHTVSPPSDTHSHNSSAEGAQYSSYENLNATHSHEAVVGPQQQQSLKNALGEVVVNPSVREAMGVVFSWQTLTQSGCYFCSFGTELAINSILGAYYLKNFPSLGQTGSGRWAAMFGLLNALFRPLGGIIADIIYNRSNAWGKKAWMHFLGIVTGILLIVIGVVDSHKEGVMFGLIVCMAFFLEAGNGANYALVPHVHPHANGKNSLRSRQVPIPTPALCRMPRLTMTAGIVSGFTGAAGNLGGIIFAIIFRYHGKDYGKVFWIIGIMNIAMNVCLSWIRPIPRGQVGGQ